MANGDITRSVLHMPPYIGFETASFVVINKLRAIAEFDLVLPIQCVSEKHYFKMSG